MVKSENERFHDVMRISNGVLRDHPAKVAVLTKHGMDIEDVKQELLIATLTALRAYEKNPEEGSTLAHFVYVSCENRLASLLRCASANKSLQGFASYSLEEMGENNIGSESQALAKIESQMVLESCRAVLRDEPVFLRLFDAICSGASLHQIAADEGVSTQAIFKRKEKMAEILVEQLPDLHELLTMS